MALCEEISSKGSEATFIRTDVTKDSDVKQMVSFALSEFGQLDFAFNNAGIFLPEPPLHEHEDSIWDQVISSNLKSVYSCMKHELSAMFECIGQTTEYGVVINNASIVGHRGSAASGIAYTSAKHGVIGLTRQAAVSYAGRNVRINAVSPGPTLTNATKAGLDLSKEQVRSKLAALNPTGELVSADDIAQTVAFLCSPAAKMISGHDIPLDGGQLAKL